MQWKSAGKWQNCSLFGPNFDLATCYIMFHLWFWHMLPWNCTISLVFWLCFCTAARCVENCSQAENSLLRAGEVPGIWPSSRRRKLWTWQAMGCNFKWSVQFPPLDQSAISLLWFWNTTLKTLCKWWSTRNWMSLWRAVQYSVPGPTVPIWSNSGCSVTWSAIGQLMRWIRKNFKCSFKTLMEKRLRPYLQAGNHSSWNSTTHLHASGMFLRRLEIPKNNFRVHTNNSLSGWNIRCCMALIIFWLTHFKEPTLSQTCWRPTLKVVEQLGSISWSITKIRIFGLDVCFMIAFSVPKTMQVGCWPVWILMNISVWHLMSMLPIFWTPCGMRSLKGNSFIGIKFIPFNYPGTVSHGPKPTKPKWPPAGESRNLNGNFATGVQKMNLRQHLGNMWWMWRLFMIFGSVGFRLRMKVQGCLRCPRPSLSLIITALPMPSHIAMPQIHWQRYMMVPCSVMHLWSNKRSKNVWLKTPKHSWNVSLKDVLQLQCKSMWSTWNTTVSPDKIRFSLRHLYPILSQKRRVHEFESVTDRIRLHPAKLTWKPYSYPWGYMSR